MSVVEKHAPGSFCWVELGTTNSAAAKAFYNGLFGWQSHDEPVGPGRVYTLLRIGGKDLGAMYEMDQSMRAMRIPPHWLQYVAVASADQSAAQIKNLGGALLKGPFDVPGAGRMAVVQDPTGAVFALWQANPHIGAHIMGELNTLCWSELATNDKSKALGFYTSLFGWSTKTNPEDPEQYTEISNGPRTMGGVMEMNKEWGNVPSHWVPYFMVANCDASVATAKKSGGSINVPPTDIPKVGRFAAIADPQGAAFAIINLTANP